MREMDRMMNSMMDPFNIFGNPFGGQRLLGSNLFFLFYCNFYNFIKLDLTFLRMLRSL